MRGGKRVAYVEDLEKKVISLKQKIKELEALFNRAKCCSNCANYGECGFVCTDFEYWKLK